MAKLNGEYPVFINVDVSEARSKLRRLMGLARETSQALAQLDEQIARSAEVQRERIQELETQLAEYKIQLELEG